MTGLFPASNLVLDLGREINVHKMKGLPLLSICFKLLMQISFVGADICFSLWEIHEILPDSFNWDLSWAWEEAANPYRRKRHARWKDACVILCIRTIVPLNLSFLEFMIINQVYINIRNHHKYNILLIYDLNLKNILNINKILYTNYIVDYKI